MKWAAQNGWLSHNGIKDRRSYTEAALQKIMKNKTQTNNSNTKIKNELNKNEEKNHLHIYFICES
jgi:uncharacterized protein YfcZ (UPF0381/DUF406 family)